MVSIITKRGDSRHISLRKNTQIEESKSSVTSQTAELNSHVFFEPVGGCTPVLSRISEKNHLRNCNSSKESWLQTTGSFFFSHKVQIGFGMIVMMMLVIAIGLNNGITGMITLNVTDTKQIGTTFTSNGEVLITLDNSPSSITLTGEHTGVTRIIINGEEVYTGEGNTTFSETKEVTGLGTEITIAVEVENSSATLNSMRYTYSQETSEPIPVWNSSVTEFSIEQGGTLEIDLDEYFADDDNLTYLATGASNVTVEIYGSVLHVIPDLWFNGERRIKAIASDEYNVVEQQIRIIVTATEENITRLENLTEPAINITPELNLSENITINITPEINISENRTINITGNLTINETLNITANLTMNITANITSNITFGNITGLRFAIEEKIIILNKTVGKKIQDEPEYEVYFTNITLTNESLLLEFYHDYNIPLPVFIEGNVNYTLSNDTAQPNETVKVIVQLREGIIPRFVLHVGLTSEVFEFGKNIPLINTKVKKAHRMKEMTRAGVKKEILGEMKEMRKQEKGQDKEEYWLIDRNDEKLDVELVSETAKAMIIGTNASQIRTAFDAVSEKIIRTEVFAAEPTEMEEAVITLKKTGKVTAIVECTDINVETLNCPSGWKKANIPFSDDGENITFSVSHFSGYAGAEITVLNVQSYPILYGNWTVEFTTTGTANLTITAVDGTTWSTDGAGTQLQFLDVKCGENVLNYSWIDNSVFIQDYNCSSIGYLTNKELMAGKHTLKFTFGNDTAYAYNDVYLGKWWFRELNLRTGVDGKGNPMNSSDIAQGVATDSSRNIIVTGYGDEGGNERYAYTVKYDEGGTKGWTALYNMTPTGLKVMGTSIAVDTSDNVFVGGHSTNSYPVCLVIKYNSAGAHQWNVTFNTTGSYFQCNGITTDSSNNVIIIAHNASATTSATSAMAIKYNNSNGAQLWNASWLGPATFPYRWMYGVATDSSNNVYVAGNWNLTYPFLIKFNSAGAYQWSRIFNQSSRSGSARGVAVDSENNIIIGGYLYNTAITDYNFLIAKYNSDGTELWNNSAVNFSRQDTAYGIAVDLEDNIIITGSNQNPFEENITTVKYNKTGTQIWNATYGYLPTNGQDSGRAVAIDNKNNVVVAGTIANGSMSHMEYNYALLKYYFDIPANSTRPILNSTDLSNRTSQNLTVYPQNTQDTLDLDSVTNVTNWYKNGKSITVLNMPFDIDTNNFTNRQEKDFSQYGNNGTVVGATWTSSGKSGGANILTEGDYITVADSANLDLVGNWTISSWVNVASTQACYGHIVSKRDDSAGAANYALRADATAAAWECYFHNGVSWQGLWSTGTVNKGTWQFITCVYNGTHLAIYQDGLFVSSAAVTGTPATNNAALRIGNAVNPSAEYLNGTVDEIRIYDYALSAAQILADNQSGAPRYNRIASSELVKGDVWHAEVTPVDGRFAGTPMMSNGVKIGTKPRMNSTILNSTDLTNRTSQNLTVYYFNATDIDNDVIQNITNWYENGKSVTLLNMPFEAKKGMHEEGTNEVGIWYFENNTKDFSGNGNNGSCTNCPISEPAGKVGMMYHFDGTNDAIRIPYDSDLAMVGKDFTIASWIYMDAEPDDWHGTLFSKSTPSGAGTEGYLFSIRGSSDGTNKNKLWGMIMNAGGFVESPGNTALATNKWYHAVMTYDYSARLVQFYLNGQPDGGFTSDRDVTDSGATSVTEIGRGLDYDGYAFNGKIDEVHVFNRSLSPSEVNALYKKGLDQAADTIDYSGYNNNGNVTGATWTSSGIKGGAYNFDGTDDRINLTLVQLNGATAFTLEMWVKPDALPWGGWEGLFGRGPTGARTPWLYSNFDPEWIYEYNDLTLEFDTNAGSGDGAGGTTNLTEGAWNFLAFTWNGSIVTSYLDGVLIMTDETVGRTMVTSKGDTQIGYIPGNQYFDGTIDEVRVYDRALSAQQILADNASGAPKYDKTVSQELSRGDVWNAEVIPNDGVEDGYAGMSNGVKIGTKPTVNTVILNSTDNTNRTSKNLTVYPTATDIDNEVIQNITNWYENGKPIAVLNMPFEGKTGMHLATTDDAGAWYFENNTKDMSQNENDGGCAGTSCPTYVTSGKVGGAYDFDGNDVIIIPDSDSLDITNELTIAFWVNRDDTQAWKRLVTKSEYTGGWTALSYYVDFDDTSHIRFFANISGNAGYSLTGTTAFAVGQWYHVTAQYTGAQMEIYINGQLEATTAASGSITTNSQALKIGADDESGEVAFVGKIDEVHIFNRSLSLPEIKALYTKGLDKVNDTIDYSGYENNGRVTGATWTSSGIKGGGYDFDGSSDFINISDSGSVEIQNKLVTISYWVKGTFDYSVSEGIILEKGGWGTGEYGMTYAGSNKPRFQIYDLSANYIDAVTATNNGAWHNVVGTWNGTNMSLYVDGVIENSTSATGTFIPDAENLYIGSRGGNSNFFDGIIDEIQIYDRALTPEQVRAYYQSGAPKYDRTASQELSKGEVWNAEVISTDGWEDGYGMSNGVQIGTAPTQNTPIVNSTYGTNYTNENLTVYSDATDIDGDSIRNITNWYKNGTSLTLLNMPFEGKISRHTPTTDDAGAWYFENNTKDMSQNENDGTCTNCPGYGASGVVGGYYSFVGAGESITVPDSPSLRLGTNQTIAVWVAYGAPNIFYSHLVGKGNSTDNRNYRLLLESDGDMYYGMTDSAGGWCGAYENGGAGSKANIGVGVSSGWHHFVATYNGATAKLYKDGTEVYSNDCTITPDTSSDPLIIGHPGAPWDPLNGALDELHIFNRTLSAAEIRNMYTKGRNHTNYAIDYSGYANDGTVTGAVFNATGGYDGRGAYMFDGVDDYITVGPNNPAQKINLDKIYTEFTFAAWINPRTSTFGQSVQQSIAEKMEPGGVKGWKIMRNNITNGINFTFYNTSAGTESSINSTIGVPNSTWTHIAFVFKANDYQQIYINGVLNANGTTLNQLNGNTSVTALAIGERDLYPDEQRFNGTIDEVLIFNSSLSASQIFALYQNRTDLIHSAKTEIGDTFFAEVTPVDGIMEGLTARSNNLTIRNAPPSILQFFINSSGIPTRDRDNLTCYANITDLEGDTPLHAYYNWYNNSVKIPSLSGNRSITAEVMTLLSFLGAGNTTKGEIWTCEARFYDGYMNSSWRNDSARIVEISPTVFINGAYNALKFNANNILLKLNEII